MAEDVANNLDSLLGNNSVEPMVNLNEFCRHRIEEVLMLTEAVKENPFRGQAFQRLPRHMRRRQMSHHIKRLPKTIRPSSSSSSKDEVPPPPRRPNRKFRRRPRNLILEYNRRQKSNVWLETHIWHSKRYSMMSKWGYKLPERPSNKSFRACYRAATQHCFLSDISYYNCLELKGLEEKLLEGLQKCTSSDIGLTFAALMYIDGSREGSVTLFHPGSYPYKAVGRVSFLWKPRQVEEQSRTIWIFSHPSFYHEIVVMLKALFELNKSDSDEHRHSVSVASEEKEKSTEEEKEKDDKRTKEEKEKEVKKDKEDEGKEKDKEDKVTEKEDTGTEREKESENEEEDDEDEEEMEEEDNEEDVKEEDEDENDVKNREKDEKDVKEGDKDEKEKELKPGTRNKEEMKLETKNIPFERTPKYKNADGSVTMSLLKDTINRFRLTGPLALSIIAEAFDVNLPVKSSSPKRGNPSADEGKDKTSKRKREKSLGDKLGVPAKKKKKNLNEKTAGRTGKKKEDPIWWREYYKNEFNLKCLESQKKFYQGLKNLVAPSDVPPNLVFSVVVKDPRLTLPPKRTKCVPEASDMSSSPAISFDSLISHSPLWESSVRDLVSLKRMTTSEINEARSKLIVPGSDPSVLLKKNQGRVPLIVIQRTGVNSSDQLSNNSGNCSGFDVIVPAGWAMPVWLSLVFRGARTGGLREMKGLLLETNSLTDYHQPDSEGGELENFEASQTFRSLHFKYPPNNRPNFAKLGVQTPFYFPWKVLIRDWRLRSHPSEGKNSDVKYYVLRDRKKLSELNAVFQNLYAMLKSQTKWPWVNIFKEEELDCLVPIAIETKGKGSPKEHAMVCLPSVEDIRGMKAKGYTTPAEVVHTDQNEEARKRLKLEHSKLLKSLKRKRKRCRGKEREEFNKKPVCDRLDDDEDEDGDDEEGKTEGPSSKDAIEEYSKKVESLWLEDPEGIRSVIDSCSRTIVGYIVLGNFSFTRGRGLGLGYVTLRGLLFLLKRCYDGKSLPSVLYRNITSLKYRLGTLRLCTG